jgi:hypothetical protein
VAGLALELDGGGAEVVGDAVRVEEVFEAAVLIGDGITLAGGLREGLLETKDFLLESLDVHLLALTVGSKGWSDGVEMMVWWMSIPLSLTVEFLASSQGRLAVRLWATTLRGLAVWKVLERTPWIEIGGSANLLFASCPG